MMSMFQMPGPDDAAKLDRLSRDLASSMPQDMAAAVSLMARPAAGMMAMSALGLGLASHAFGIWVGAIAGAAQASQRLFMPLASEDEDEDTSPRTSKQPAAVAPLAFPKRPKPALKVVVQERPVERATAASASDAAEPVTPVSRSAPIVEPNKAVTAALMPEDFRKPASVERPAAPDDLKAISGIGPKLEKVLNDLGVWTYAQVAAWGKEEVAWADDYLGFRGRIDRDGWVEQARSLAGTAKQG